MIWHALIFSLYQTKFKSMSYPFDLPLKEYGGILKNKKYWDEGCVEWTFSPFDDKIKHLAGFVQNGGNLMDVLDGYAEDHPDWGYRMPLQGKVLDYTMRIMRGKEWHKVIMETKNYIDLRIMCFTKEELVELFTEELKRDVKFCYDHWEFTSDTEPVNDDILEKIERRHKQAHPNESVKKKIREWIRNSLW